MDLEAHPFDTILYARKRDVGYVTLNRPKVMNALSRQTVAELHTVFQSLRDNAEIRGVILSGAGDRAFIAGADISELVTVTASEAEQRARDGQDLLNLIEGLRKPVIAAINGVALGGGCETALACTIRIAVATARFGQPEIKLGLIPGYGGTQRLARTVGKSRAMQMILTGETITAEDAYRVGLVSEIVDASALISRAEEILASITANAPLAIGFAIDAVSHGLDGSLSEGLALERTLFGLCAATDDREEGVTAFLQKRKAVFSGH